MQAVVLAGGLGTRLRSVVSDRPKPMAEVNGKPFLEYQIRYFVSQGLHDVVMCVGYLGQMIEAYFGDGSRFGIHIGYSYESEPLGTAGALGNARKLLEENFAVINGDTYFKCDYQRMTDYHLQKGSLATLGVVKGKSGHDYGNIRLDGCGRIVGFAEKQGEDAGFINAGVYIMNRAVLDFIPENCRFSIETDLLPLLICKKSAIFGYLAGHSRFTDIGIPARYFEFIEHVRAIQENPHRS